MPNIRQTQSAHMQDLHACRTRTLYEPQAVRISTVSLSINVRAALKARNTTPQPHGAQADMQPFQPTTQNSLSQKYQLQSAVPKRTAHARHKHIRKKASDTHGLQSPASAASLQHLTHNGHMPLTSPDTYFPAPSSNAPTDVRPWCTPPLLHIFTVLQQQEKPTCTVPKLRTCHTQLPSLLVVSRTGPKINTGPTHHKANILLTYFSRNKTGKDGRRRAREAWT